MWRKKCFSISSKGVSNNFQNKLSYMNILFLSKIKDWFENTWKSISRGREMPDAGRSQAHTLQAAGDADFGRTYWTSTEHSI